MIFLTKKSSDKTAKKDDSSDIIEICDAEKIDIIPVDEKNNSTENTDFLPAELPVTQEDITEVQIKEPVPETSAAFDGEALQKKLEEVKEAILSSIDKDRIIGDLHDELLEHRRNFKQEITLPLIKSIIRLADNLTALTTVYSRKFETVENLPSEAGDLLNEVASARDNVLITLEEFEYEEFLPACGEEFSAKEHKCVGKRPAENGEEKNTIAEVVKAGFKNESTGKIIRYPEVIIFA